jgi:hypothetical protein
MNHALAAACNTGTWQQKWSCGWHQPPSAAVAHAGFVFGHSILPWLIGAAIGLIIVIRGRRGHRAAAAAAAAAAGNERRR